MTRTLRQIEAHRKGEAVIRVRREDGRPGVGVRVFAEQATHEFAFACVAGDLTSFSKRDRERYRRRAGEVFNRVDCPPGPQISATDLVSVDATNPVRLGALRAQLDRIARDGKQLDVHVSGRTVILPGDSARDRRPVLSERDFALRIVDLYTLLFSHAAIRRIAWHGLSDREPGIAGRGLLRRDLVPTHAHKLLRKLVNTIWHGRATGETDSLGDFHFCGFFGLYRVVLISPETTPHMAELSVTRGAEGQGLTVVEIPDRAIRASRRSPSASRARKLTE